MFTRSSDTGHRAALPGVMLKTLAHGSRTLAAEFHLKKASAIPRHSHPHEQTGYLVRGALRLTIGKETFEARPGDCWCIKGGVEHEVAVLEDSVAIEVFSPVREEYLPAAALAQIPNAMSADEIHGTFDDVLRAAGPGLSPICKALRKLIASLDPDFVEVVWPRQKIASFGMGPKKKSEHYAYIGVQTSHVNIGFYHGASLRDPAGLLEGTGKGLRHVKIRDVSEVRNAALAVLLRDAIKDRKAHVA